MHVKRWVVVFLIISFFPACTHTSGTAPKSRLTVVFLPLIPRDDTSREFCDRVTATLAAELRTLDLFDLAVSENLLREFRLKGYSWEHARLQQRIRRISKPDFVLSGYISTNKERGLYSLSLDLANFSKFGNIYRQDYLNGEDMDELIHKHVALIKRLRPFLADPDAALEAYLTILRTHSPETFPIIGGMSKKYQDEFILGYLLPEPSLTNGFGVAIHEGLHASAYTGRPDLMALYISPRETIRIQITPVFPTRELVAVIPERFRTGRFKPYINPPHSNASAQIIGVYGLLNELDAYYQGTRVACDLLSYYKESIFGEDPEAYFEFLSGMYSTYAAYYEIKYFIYAYLLHAEKNKPAVYKGIIDNAQFKDAFRKIDTAYGRLIQRVYAIENELNDILKQKGLQLTKKGVNTWIRKADGSGSGRSNYQDTVSLLDTELQKDEYRRLERQLYR